MGYETGEGVALITISGYYEDAEHVSERLNSLGYYTVIRVIDKPHVQLVTDADVCRSIRDTSSKLRYIIVPYTANVKIRRCGSAIIVKGPRHIHMLPDLLQVVNLQAFEEKDADEIISDNIHRVLDKAFSNINSLYKKAWCIDKLCIPKTPPPIIVASDLYATRDPEATLRIADQRISSGADFIVLGVGGVERRSYMANIELLLERGITVAVDSPIKTGLLVDALDMGAHIGFSLTRGNLNIIPSRLREEKAFVIIPETLGDYSVRIEELTRAEREAVELGYNRVILDPVAQPIVTPGLMRSLMASWHLSRIAENPIMIGINNAIELLDADTPGAVAFALGLIAESGVSIVMVSEESWKARGLTFEARIAADMASLALYWRTTMKDLGLNLLVLKEKSSTRPD